MGEELKCPHCGCSGHISLTLNMPVDIPLNNDGTTSLENYSYNHVMENILMAVFEGNEKVIENRYNLLAHCEDCHYCSYPVLDYTQSYDYDEITRILALFKTKEERDKKSDNVRLLRKLGD